MTTQEFLRTSGRAAALFIALMNQFGKANLSDEDRFRWSMRTLEAYQPENASTLSPTEQLKRLRMVRHDWQRRLPH